MNMLKILFILLVVLPLPLADAYDLPDSIWVINDGRYRFIAVNVYDDPSKCESGKACTTTSSIILIKGFEFHPTKLGCNAWTHEVLHMWGYSHEDMERDFWCEY